MMREAIRLATESVERGGGPFGAVIVKDGEIIAGRSNSVTIDNDPTAHAEVNAIRDAARRLGTFDLSGCYIYTSCEPCRAVRSILPANPVRCVSAPYTGPLSIGFSMEITARTPPRSASTTISSTGSWTSPWPPARSPSVPCCRRRPFPPSASGTGKQIKQNIDPMRKTAILGSALLALTWNHLR